MTPTDQRVMFALQPLQHFLLGLLGSQPTDAFGQGGSGVARDDAQMTFQRSKGWLVVVASVLERFVQAALQLDGAEQGGDAATVEGLGVLADVVLAVALAVLGCVLGVLWLQVVVDGLEDQSATFVEQSTEFAFEVAGGSRGERCGVEGGDQGSDLIAESVAGFCREGEDMVQGLEKGGSQSEG